MEPEGGLRGQTRGTCWVLAIGTRRALCGVGLGRGSRYRGGSDDGVVGGMWRAGIVYKCICAVCYRTYYLIGHERDGREQLQPFPPTAILKAHRESSGRHAETPAERNLRSLLPKGKGNMCVRDSNLSSTGGKKVGSPKNFCWFGKPLSTTLNPSWGY